MYKTVRHGENCLQYTILPQTEELLYNSGLKGKGRDYSPSIHMRRSKRRSALKYILLIVLGIIIALCFASVPLYVLNGAIYARRSVHDHHELTTSPFNTAGREIMRSRKKELKTMPEVTTAKVTEPTVAPTTPTTVSSPSTTTEKTTIPPWIIPSIIHRGIFVETVSRSWKTTSSSTTQAPTTEDSAKIPLVGTPSGSVRLLDHYMSMKPWENDIIIRATVTPEPVTIRNIFKYYSRAFKPSDKITTTGKVFDDVLITTKGTTQLPTTSENPRSNRVPKLKNLKDTILSADDDDDFKQSLEVDEVFSLPPLKSYVVKDLQEDEDEVKVSKAYDSDDYDNSRWPFVDAASYFKWTRYQSDDNLLLPLLVASLITVVLVLLVGYIVQRRKRAAQVSPLVKSRREAEAEEAKEQADDKTQLLAGEEKEE